MSIRRVFSPLLAWAMLLATTLAPKSSIAQTVYRCGPDGTQYSQQACPRGRAVDVADPRSEDQVLQGQRSAERATGLALELRKQRMERDKDAASLGQGPALIRHAAVVSLGEPATSTLRGKDLGKKRGKPANELAQKSPKKPSKKPRHQAVQAA